MLDFKKRVLQFKLDGEVHEVRYPSVKEIKLMQERQKKKENEFVVLEEVLIDLGLKKEIFDTLEVDHLSSIVEMLVNPKK